MLSLGDQVDALKAAAAAFNDRGGANGACIEVLACDDKASVDSALACARRFEREGVVVTVNDQQSAGQAEVAEVLRAAGIARVAGQVSSQDWGDENAYPLDGSGLGATFMMAAGLVHQGVRSIGLIRVDSPAATALIGLLRSMFADEGVSFPYESPVPAGTTDYSQFVLGAQNAGAGGIMLAIGEQEAVQVARAAQQLGSKLRIAAATGNFPYSVVKRLGDAAAQMVFVAAYPPATADVPVYEALRADLAASGEAKLQPENLTTRSMRLWIGLYALLRILRDADVKDLTRQNVAAAVKAAKNVPMLGIYGDQSWTSDANHPGLFKRAGLSRWRSGHSTSTRCCAGRRSVPPAPAEQSGRSEAAPSFRAGRGRNRRETCSGIQPGPR